MPASSHAPNSPLRTVDTQEPGHAVVHWDWDTDVVTIEHADPVIRVSDDMLDFCFRWAWDGETLTLDTAGTHCYHRVGPDPVMERVSIFSRIF